MLWQQAKGDPFLGVVGGVHLRGRAEKVLMLWLLLGLLLVVIRRGCATWHRIERLGQIGCSLEDYFAWKAVRIAWVAWDDFTQALESILDCGVT